jgi:cytidylate kinase
VRRRESEQKRYMSLYAIDVLDTSSFDLVIDTATKNLDGVATEVLERYRAWLGAER